MCDPSLITLGFVNETRWCKYFKSSLGLKILMSLTGLGMALFLLVHMAGNLILILSTEKYNEYSHALTSNKILLYTAEAGLIGLVLIHIYVAIVLTRRNRAARPVAYYKVSNTGRSRRFFGSSYMGISGTLVLIYIIYHLKTMKWGTYVPTEQHGVAMRDLSSTVIAAFKSPFEVGLYTVAMIVIAVHLWHGIRSLFDTLGVAKSSWDQFFILISRLYVVIVMGGFVIIPLYVYFCV